jgi:hypothetical protein
MNLTRQMRQMSGSNFRQDSEKGDQPLINSKPVSATESGWESQGLTNINPMKHSKRRH